ncbi:MAG: LPS O-antigen subunit length determinant protein (WzzB/FepE family) [Polaribacter sp.]|jgi:LPS O-antigen subunit length determinant protein (WzzB/FepE family)
MIQENNTTSQDQEDAIDIIALLKNLWVARKTILKITFAFTFLGLFVAVFSENEFTASTTFVPLAQGSSLGVGGLGSLASLAGINIGGGVNSEEISPELYPQIVSSVPFQLELLNTPLTIEGQTRSVSYSDYYENIYSPGLLSNIIKYTFGLPGVLIKLVRSAPESMEAFAGVKESKLIAISKKDYELIEGLEDRVILAVNAQEGFISISVTLPEAIASAELALKAQQLLQEYALEFKTQKSIEQLTYIEERYAEKEKAFKTIQISLARFQDQNTGINTALGRTKLLQLQSEYDLAFTVYSELAKQLETQLLQVKKDTPLFTVLKPVTIPIERSAPKRALILVLYLFLGFVLSLGFVSGRKALVGFKKEWASK